MSIDIDKVVINVKITEGKMKAMVGLDFGDFVVKGYRILLSNYDKEDKPGEKDLWVIPPSYKGGNKYHPMFFFVDENIWGKLRDRIIEAYYVKLKKHHGKIYELTEEELKEIREE